KTIVFCVDNEHAAQMRDALQAASTSWARAGDIVRIVDDDKRDGKLALSNFCSTTERQPVVVTTSKLLSTGIDAPTCKNIVLARAVGSMVEFKQIIGRGTRLFGQDKTWFTILDYAGAIKHFFDPSFDGNPEFIMNEPLLPQETENTTPTHQEEPAEPTPTTARAEAATDEQQAQADSMETARAAEEKTPQTPLEYAYEIKEPDTSTYEIEEEADASRYTLIRPADQRVEAHEHHATDYEQGAIPPAAPVVEAPTASLSVSGDGARVQSGRTKPPVRVQPAKPHVVAERTDGTRIEVQGEIWFELGADGRRLRMQTIQEWAKLMLHNLVPTPQELSARWIEPLQREEIVEILAEQIVALDVLAREMHLEDVDPFDVLLQAVFGTPALTRAERVTRLRQQQVTFFQRFEQNPLASRVVHAILDWYMHVPIGISAYEEQDTLDISDMQLLSVPSIAQPEERMEIAQAFQHCGQPIRATLKELKRLLYHV
ncbi:MAG: hypothetical protein ABI413_12130, partial [Ktedonobacteraceae bacterium]